MEIFKQLIDDSRALGISILNPRAAQLLSRIHVPHTQIRCNYPEWNQNSTRCGYFLHEQLTDGVWRDESVQFPLNTCRTDPYILVEKELISETPILGFVAAYGLTNGLQIDLSCPNEPGVLSTRLHRNTSTGPFELIGNQEKCAHWLVDLNKLTSFTSDEIFGQIITNQLFKLKKIDHGIYAYSM